jgi:hypothetical protein
MDESGDSEAECSVCDEDAAAEAEMGEKSHDKLNFA